ncbi:MAG: hypothetical protein LH472_15195 [Pyrinomonadaceae bacterium]|nr:hypothetical protein [Pyrinomonadaceae bacterium]
MFDSSEFTLQRVPACEARRSGKLKFELKTRRESKLKFAFELIWQANDLIFSDILPSKSDW